MAEGAFNQSLVLHVDDDGEREVISFAPGPAGVAEIELAPGTYLSVDYAEPTTLCSIRTTRAADPRVIAALIGDEAMSIVMSTPPTDRPVRIEVPGLGRQFSSDPELLNREAREFGRAASLASAADEASRHEFARGVAALELAEQMARVRLPDSAIEWMTDDAYVQAVALLRDGIDALGRAEAIGPGALDQVARMLGDVPGHSPAALQARELRHAVLSVAHRSTVAAKAHPSPAMAPPLAERMATPIPLPVGRFPARFDAAAAGAWARLIDGSSLELVAIAPITTARGETRADLLVSPMLDWSRLESDARAEPLTAVDTVTAVRRAVRLGRRAVEAEVLRRRSAADAWRMCAGAWRALGDEHRAALAERHATRSVGRRPMLNERIGQAVGAA